MSSQEQPRSSQEQPGAARSRPGTARDSQGQLKMSTAHAPEHGNAPRGIQSSNSAQEWRTFIMKMNTAHSFLHRHGCKVIIRCGTGINTVHSALHRHGYKVTIR
jgi:hypothetical protein